MAGQIFVVLAGDMDISVGVEVSLLSIVAVVFSSRWRCRSPCC